jgi:hypothetical protein
MLIDSIFGRRAAVRCARRRREGDAGFCICSPGRNCIVTATKNYRSYIVSSQLSLKLSTTLKTTKMTIISSKLAIPAARRLQPAHNIVVSNPDKAF